MPQRELRAVSQGWKGKAPLSAKAGGAGGASPGPTSPGPFGGCSQAVTVLHKPGTLTGS